MAVTRLLARVTGDTLAACREAALTSPTGDSGWRRTTFNGPAPDWLDLDWAPAPLQRAFTLAGAPVRQRVALARALDGGSAVDVGYLNRRGPADAFAPAALDPAEVVEIDAALHEADLPAVLAALPADGHAARAAVGAGMESLTADPRAYLTVHFEALRAFYEGAALRGLYVVVWWD